MSTEKLKHDTGGVYDLTIGEWHIATLCIPTWIPEDVRDELLCSIDASLARVASLKDVEERVAKSFDEAVALATARDKSMVAAEPDESMVAAEPDESEVAAEPDEECATLED